MVRHNINPFEPLASHANGNRVRGQRFYNLPMMLLKLSIVQAIGVFLISSNDDWQWFTGAAVAIVMANAAICVTIYVCAGRLKVSISVLLACMLVSCVVASLIFVSFEQMHIV